jgi:ubiquinol-cytochrome c reductase subunit 9
MAGSSFLYSAIFKRNSVFLTTIFAAAFVFEMATDTGFNYIWDRVNKGRQWKDIRHKYIEQEES